MKSSELLTKLIENMEYDSFVEDEFISEEPVSVWEIAPLAYAMEGTINESNFPTTVLPTLGKGVQLEWLDGNYEVTFEIDIKGNKGTIYVDNFETNENEEYDDLKIDSPDTWDLIKHKLKNK